VSNRRLIADAADAYMDGMPRGLPPEIYFMAGFDAGLVVAFEHTEWARAAFAEADAGTRETRSAMATQLVEYLPIEGFS